MQYSKQIFFLVEILLFSTSISALTYIDDFNVTTTGNTTADYFFGKLNWSYIQNAPTSDWLSTYNATYHKWGYNQTVTDIWVNESGDNITDNAWFYMGSPLNPAYMVFYSEVGGSTGYNATFGGASHTYDGIGWDYKATALGYPDTLVSIGAGIYIFNTADNTDFVLANDTSFNTYWNIKPDADNDFNIIKDSAGGIKLFIDYDDDYVGVADDLLVGTTSCSFVSRDGGDLCVNDDAEVAGDFYVGRNLNVSKNVTASYFFGNGSQLTDISYTETDPIFIAENSSLWSEAQNKFNSTYDAKADYQFLDNNFNGSGNITLTGLNSKILLDWEGSPANRWVSIGRSATDLATIESYSYLYIKAGGATAGYFTSNGFNYIDNNGMILGSPVIAKANSIYGQSSSQIVGGIKIYSAMLGVASTDYSPPNYVAGRYWYIADSGDEAFNFQHGVQANPTLFIHSNAQSTTQWLGLSHNETSAILESGAGGFNINSTSGDFNIVGGVQIAGGYGLGVGNGSLPSCNGCVNASTIYYETLTPKSPIIFELEGTIILTRIRGGNWIECDYNVKGNCPIESENKMKKIIVERVSSSLQYEKQKKANDCGLKGVYDYNPITEECILNLQKKCESTSYQYYKNGICYKNPILKCTENLINEWDGTKCVVNKAKECEQQEDMLWTDNQCVLNLEKQKERLKHECANDRSKYWNTQTETCDDVGGVIVT